MPKGIPKKGINKGRFKKGIIPFNKGKKLGFVPKSAFKKGNPKPTNAHVFPKMDKHPNWKKSGVSYSGIHYWVSRYKGKPKVCEQCGTTKARKFEWANIDHSYRRVLDDYIRMCTRCHRRFDNKT